MLKKKFLHTVLTFAVFAAFFSAVWKKSDLFMRFDAKFFEEKFNKSQWRDPNSKEKISDADLYIYAGTYYLNGGDITVVNPETPPFGKYIIGLILKILPYPNLLGILASLFFFVAVYLLVSKVESSPSALLVLVLLSLDPLLRMHFVGFEFLDMFYAGLLILFVYFFYKFMKKQRALDLILAALYLGMASGTKAFLSTWVIGLAFAFLLLFFSKIKAKVLKYAMFGAFSSLTVWGSYVRFFWNKPSLLSWLKLQKWTLNFYQIGYQKSFWYNPLSYMFVNKWLVDWQPQAIVLPYWSFLWPLAFLVFVGFFLRFSFLFLKKKAKSEDYLIVWPTAYLLFLFVNPYFWPRYIIPLLPFFYYCLYKFGEIVYKKSIYAKNK